MHLSKKWKLIASGTTLAVIAAASLVYAAWTTSGSGSGYAKAGSAQALSTVDASASTAATLTPGSTGDVRIEIRNPNPYPVQVTGVSGNGTITTTASGCTTTGVTFTNQTGLTLNLPAKSGGTDGALQTTLSGAASMSNASLNACQGATFTIPVTLTGTSNAS